MWGENTRQFGGVAAAARLGDLKPVAEQPSIERQVCWPLEGWLLGKGSDLWRGVS